MHQDDAVGEDAIHIEQQQPDFRYPFGNSHNQILNAEC
jgi:hypothetical protein